MMKLKLTPGRAFALCLHVSLSVAVAGASMAGGKVFLNEMTFSGIQLAELYNLGPDPVNLTGWRILGDGGSYTIPSGTMINPNQYLAFPIGAILGPIGGETSLIDDIASEQDAVDYGTMGSAPLAPPGASLARAPDGSADPPRIPSLDGAYWTIDFSPTLGAQNNVPPPGLGSFVKLNEMHDAGANGDDIEIFNPSALHVDLTGWILTDGQNVVVLVGEVMGGGVVGLFNIGTAIETTPLAYLFDRAGVRIDQVGLLGAPAGFCSIGRCPDGAGSSYGYDYLTTGGGGTWIPMTCTIGQPNTIAPECHPEGIEEGPAGVGGSFRMGRPEPNPADERVWVEVNLPQQSRVLVEVFAPSGLMAVRVADEVMGAGRHGVVARMNDLPAGVYFLRGVCRGSCQTRMFVIAR